MNRELRLKVNKIGNDIRLAKGRGKPYHQAISELDAKNYDQEMHDAIVVLADKHYGKCTF